MKELNTINDVVLSLDAIVQESVRTQSRAGYFAALYKRMTMAVSEGIQKGQFEDGPRMEALDILFAERYLAAYNAFKKNEECSSSWQYALTGCNNCSLVVLQHLLLGINAHVNLDLAIAAARLVPGDKIHALEKDFNHINVLISDLIDDVQKCLEEVWFPMRFLRDVINRQGIAVLNFSMAAARKTAWANAVLLAHMSEAEKEKHIKDMDAMVNGIGQRISHPGLWPGILLRIIRFTEYEDVVRTIRLIDTTVV
ncbi:MAG TPA: DUF5995 family protein [Flavisolibacter sp.]|nr:DUF5995 family protein [Flavisolibacter sp.]